MRNAYVALPGDEAAGGEVIDQRPVDGRTFELMSDSGACNRVEFRVCK
jgi:hypothetical protein